MHKNAIQLESFDYLLKVLQIYSIPLDAQSHVIPVLISVEQWKGELNARDEEIIEYTLRKAGAEIIFQDDSGCVIPDQNGFYKSNI